MNVSTLSTDVETSLSFSQDTTKNGFLVTLNQSYYTMSFELPSKPEDLFAEDVSGADIAPYVDPGNPAVYVS